MGLPSKSKPKPSVIEITDRGAQLLIVSAVTTGAVSVEGSLLAPLDIFVARHVS
jgi:hypothetical protein